MTHDVISRLTELLLGFKTVGGIEASLITTRSGVNLASLVPRRANADTLAAMSSALLNAADIMADKLGRGASERIVIECEHSKLLVMGAGPQALFVVLANDNANLGSLFLEMGYTVATIEQMMNV